MKNVQMEVFEFFMSMGFLQIESHTWHFVPNLTCVLWVHLCSRNTLPTNLEPIKGWRWWRWWGQLQIGVLIMRPPHQHFLLLSASAHTHSDMEIPGRQNQSFSPRQWDPWWAASIVIIEFATMVMDFYAFLPSLCVSLMALLNLYLPFIKVLLVFFLL